MRCKPSLLLIIMLNVGCASFGQRMKAFLGGNPKVDPVAAQKSASPTYSETPDYYTGPKRQYRRTTHSSLKEESQLRPEAGSLWSMEGQGAYLFSQNIMRMVGDPIGIVIDGEPREQLETKASVIEKLLRRLEERQMARLRGPAAAEGDGESASTDSTSEEGKKSAQPSPNPAAPANDQKSNFNVRTVPTRIVERLADGNYRVKGSQPVMIGTREYKVIVTGIVRAEDFNDQGLSATKLLDPKFDIVSARRSEAG